MYSGRHLFAILSQFRVLSDLKNGIFMTIERKARLKMVIIGDMNDLFELGCQKLLLYSLKVLRKDQSLKSTRILYEKVDSTPYKT